MSRQPLIVAGVIATLVMCGQAQESRRLMGLVEVPAVFNRVTPDGNVLPPQRPIELRARPVPGSAIVATVTDPSQLEADEYRYEESAAVAYARRGEWTLVKTRNGVAGWLAPQDAGTYRSLESLLQDHYELAELTAAWDGWIRTAPGSDTRDRVLVDPGRSVIGLLRPAVEDTTRYPVFERADRRSRVLARVESANPERTLQTTGDFPYEIVVLERRPGWFRVARAGDIGSHLETAWLPASPAWRFHSSTADEERAVLARRAVGRDIRPVRVRSTRYAGGALWVEIEVLDHSLCEGTTPIVRQRGWVPAHAQSGELNVWFPSRGC